MSMTDKRVEVEEFDFHPRCRRASCEGEATWMGILSCCGDQSFSCDLHKSEMDAYLKSSIDTKTNHHIASPGDIPGCGRAVDLIEWYTL